jgi:hypothetical protein
MSPTALLTRLIFQNKNTNTIILSHPYPLLCPSTVIVHLSFLLYFIVVMLIKLLPQKLPGGRSPQGPTSAACVQCQHGHHAVFPP